MNLANDKRDMAVSAIRDAILGIDWTLTGGDALNNAWAALNTALVMLDAEPIYTSEDCDRIRWPDLHKTEAA